MTDPDVEAGIDQFKAAYSKVLLIVDSLQQKGYEIRPVITENLELTRVEVQKHE